MTKREMFESMLTIETIANNQELVDFINHEIELLNRKSGSKKPTAKQIENEGFKTEILNFLTEQDTSYNISELLSEIPSLIDSEGKQLTSQRVSALMKQLVDTGKVNKSYVKRTPYFIIAH